MSEGNTNLEIIGSEINAQVLEEGLETINLNEVKSSRQCLNIYSTDLTSLQFAKCVLIKCF